MLYPAVYNIGSGAVLAQGSSSKARRCEICRQLYVFDGAVCWQQSAARLAEAASRWRDEDSDATWLQLWTFALRLGRLSYGLRHLFVGSEADLYGDLEPYKAPLKQYLSALRWAPEALLVYKMIPNLPVSLSTGSWPNLTCLDPASERIWQATLASEPCPGSSLLCHCDMCPCYKRCRKPPFATYPG